jgi:polysaccharide pyruvyl transferase WcaK-like protein
MFTVATHEWMGAQSRRLIRMSDWTIAGGTSLLSSRMWFRGNWKVTPIDALSGLDVVLMGAGWYQYQGAADPYSRWMLRSLLSRSRVHSVRDSYARTKLASIGIANVVNTGCPTLWHLNAAHCARLPKQKAESVLTTVNSYPKLYDRAADQHLIEILRRHYRNVYLWIQTHSDYEYARALDANLIFVNPSLKALDAVLASNLDIDYVGNRLHAGIRALQKGRRAIIVEIDNRAREMGSDFGLPTVPRTEFSKLERMITECAEIAIRLPYQDIARWKDQFRLHETGRSEARA